MTTLMHANKLYNRRENGTRFATVAEMVQDAQHDKQLSAEVTYNWKDLCFAPAGAGSIQLVSPRSAADLSHRPSTSG